MRCTKCSYRILEHRSGTYRCEHPNARFARYEWERIPMLMSDTRAPRWCPLSGSSKMERGFEKLIVTAFHSETFDPIKNSEFLNEIEKEIIIKRYSDGKSYSTIAKEMGLERRKVRRIEIWSMDKVRLTLYRNSLIDKKFDGNSPNTDPAGELSVRSREALMKADLRSDEEIVNYILSQNTLEPAEALMQLKRIGRKSAQEILEYLKIKNLYN